MYEVAARLDPDSYLALARAVYAEMALAGISCVGEFHYLHHQPGGRPYADPNAMGRALVQAAAEAGLRITLLDTCYLAGGLDKSGVLPLAGPQLRFGDGDGDAVGGAGRRARPGRPRHARPARAGRRGHPLGPRGAAGAACTRSWPGRSQHGAPLHVHLSEQRAENDACRAVYGVTPAQLLYDEDVLGPRTTVVHATHLGAADLELLGGSRAFACLCPTTERDLGDGIGPGPPAGRGRLRAHPRQRQPRGHRPARGGPRGRVRRTAGPPRARPLHRRGPAPGGHRRPATPAWAGRTPGRSPPAPGPTWSPCPWTRLRTAGAAGELALEAAVFAASSTDIRTVVIGGRDVVRDGSPPARPRRPRRAGPHHPRRPRLALTLVSCSVLSPWPALATIDL